MSVQKKYNVIKRAKVKQKEAPISKISLGEITKILVHRSLKRDMKPHKVPNLLQVQYYRKCEVPQNTISMKSS